MHVQTIGDELTDELLLCPNCTEGVLFATEIIKDDPKNRIKRHYYSCGYCVDEYEITTKIGVKAYLPRMVSGTGDLISPKHREFEINDRFKDNDIDQ